MEGHLQLPENASGIVLFAQGGGCARHSPRTQFVAEMIRQAGIGTLVLDLLVQAEEPAWEFRPVAHLVQAVRPAEPL